MILTYRSFVLDFYRGTLRKYMAIYLYKDKKGLVVWTVFFFHSWHKYCWTCWDLSMSYHLSSQLCACIFFFNWQNVFIDKDFVFCFVVSSCSDYFPIIFIHILSRYKHTNHFLPNFYPQVLFFIKRNNFQFSCVQWYGQIDRDDSLRFVYTYRYWV